MEKFRFLPGAVFISLLSTVLGFLICEGIVRVFLPQQLILIRPDIFCPNPQVGWKHCPNVNTLVNTGQGSVRFQTDGDGYRIGPSSKEILPSGQILTIGDSFVEAMQVEGHETIPERIASLFLERYYKKVSVTNAGVSGWDPNQYLIQARQELSQTKYDLGIVFLSLANDIVLKAKHRFPSRKSALHKLRMPRSLHWKEMVNSVLYPINDYLEMRSHLFVLAKNTFAVSLMKFGFRDSIALEFLKENADSPGWKVTAKICKHIADIFQSYGTPVVFVLIPAIYQVDKSEVPKFLKGLGIPPERVDLDQPNVLLARELSRLGLEVIDPLDNMRAIQDGGKALYGRIDNHCNKSGYNALAEFVLPYAEKIVYRKLQ